MVTFKRYALPRALGRIFVPLMAGLALGAPAAVLAHDSAPTELIAETAPPSDWQHDEFMGVRYSFPSDWPQVQSSSNGFIRFGGDVESRSGPGFGMVLTQDPADFLDTDSNEGSLVSFAGGRLFSRFVMHQSADGVEVEVETFVSQQPYVNDRFLIITMLSYSGPLAEHRAVFDRILGAIRLPGANEQPKSSFLEGGFMIGLPPEWSAISVLESVILSKPGAMGQVQVARHPAVPGQGYLNPWYLAADARGTPVTMLGRAALMFERQETSLRYHDGSDDPQITRLFVFENCAEGPDTLSLEVTGLPSFHASAELGALLDGIEVQEGIAICGPDNLPPGVAVGTPGDRPDGRAFLAGAQASGTEPAGVAAGAPAATTEESAGTALDGLVSYVAPPGWFAMSETDTLTLIHPDGRGFVAVARGQAVLAPDGIVGQMPPGRMGSFSGDHYMEWTEIGWPAVTAEFIDQGKPAEGWHFVRIARACLPGQVPVAIHYAGIDRFRTGETLTALLRGLVFHWPDGMEECALRDAGYDQFAPAPESLGDTPDEGSGDRIEGATGLAPEPGAAPAPPAAGSVPKSATAPADAPEQHAEADLLVPPPPPATPDAAALFEPDIFTEGEGGYALYQNARYGTFISYPATYFTPERAPGSGDGRTFVSADGASRFYVFAQYDALGLTQDEMMQQDETLGSYDEVTYRASGVNWYVLSGHVGRNIFYRKVILDPSGLVQTFEIVYPARLKESFDPVVTYMAESFGPGTSADDLGTGPDPAWDDEFPRTPVQVAELMTPARNTRLRKDLLNVAREPVEADLGRDIVFVVSVLRTDGHWAYLQGVPHNPDGSRINWATTRFAREMQQGVMSDVAMVLMRKLDGRWGVLDYIFGPTDVYWLNWANAYELDEALFTP